jgi:hypothetical protein
MAIQIKAKKQLRVIKNELTKKASVNTLKIVVLNDSLAFDITKTVSNSLDLEVGSKVVPFGNTEMLVDNFTDTIVSVEFRPIGDNKAVFSKAILFASIGIKFDGKKTDVVSISKYKERIFGYSFMTKKRRQINNLKELMKEGYALYVAGAYSASEARKYSTTLYKCNKSEDIEKVLNNLTYGALKQLKGKEMTIEELQKAAARMGQWKTGMTHMEESSMTVAYFCDKWKIDDTQYGDGKAYLRDVKVAQCLSNEKYEVDRNAVEGLLIQNRPFSICKTLSKVTNSDYLRQKLLFDTNHDPDNVIWINREEVTPEQQREFNNLFIKGTDSKFKGKVVIVKPKDVPEDLRVVDYYTDLNGIKASYDLRLDSGLNILAIDKPLKGGTVNTNMQQLESLIMADPVETKNVLTNIATAFNKTSYYNVLNAKAKVPSIKEIQQMYTAGIVKSIAPGFALQNQKIFGVIADQAVQAMIKRVQGLNYQVPGQSRILQMDFGAEFGVRILMPGTCFVPGIKEKWILGTRNPKQHTGEFLLLKNLTIKEVVALIKEKVKDKQIQNLLIREYRLLSDSTVVVPAIEEIKDAIGGADVDGDTLTLVFHRKLTAIIKKAVKENKLKSTAIEVSNSSQKQDKDRKFNLKAIHSAFVELINNGNLTIGEITFMNNFILGLLFDLMQDKNEKAAIEFFKFAGNDGYGVDYYNPLNREELEKIDMNKIHVSFEETKRVVQNIKTMKLTKENMIAALDDLNAIFMMLQMETIDAPKKGTTVPVPYQGLLNQFQQNSKTRLDIDLGIVKRDLKMAYTDENDVFHQGYKQTNDGVKFLVEQREGWHVVGYGRNGEPIMKYFHNDVMHEIRVEIAREVMRTARTLRRRYDNAKYSEDIQQFFISAKDAVDTRLVYDLLELKNLYNSINAGVSQNEEENPFYNDYINALANTVRLVTAHMDDVARAELVEAVSAPASTTRSMYSSFAMNTIKEEYIKMVTRNFADVNVAGEPLVSYRNIEEGDTLEFKFGVASSGEKFAATKENICGKFTLRKINNRFYATKPIEEVLPEVELTNEIVFRASDQDLYALRQALVNAENVELKIEFGKGNLIVADGKVVGKFITSSGFGPLNRLYQDNNGVIERIMVVQERMNNGDMKDALIAVLNCDSTPEVANMEAENKTIEDIALENMNATESSEEDLF